MRKSGQFQDIRSPVFSPTTQIKARLPIAIGDGDADGGFPRSAHWQLGPFMKLEAVIYPWQSD
jgi:hypothetical protein